MIYSDHSTLEEGLNDGICDFVDAKLGNLERDGMEDGPVETEGTDDGRIDLDGDLDGFQDGFCEG